MQSGPRVDAHQASHTPISASRSQLQGVLEDLEHAQHAVQRAHTLVANLLSIANQISTNHGIAPTLTQDTISPNIVPSSFHEQQLGIPQNSKTPCSPNVRNLSHLWDPASPKSQLRVKVSAKDPTNLHGAARSPKITSGMSPKVSTPGVGARQGSPTIRRGGRQQESWSSSQSAASKGHHGEFVADPNDRFATPKTEAFMLRHAAGWDKK